MKAIRIHNYGDVDQFKVDEVPVPVPGPGEVLIKLAASAVNHFDIMLRDGRMAQIVPLELPAILGGDGAGTIEVVGPEVGDFQVGDRVIADFATNGRGSHAGYGIAPVTAIAILPDSLSFETGVTLPKAGLTARGSLDQIDIKPGDRVLVSGALGAVGRAAVQYLKEIGAIPVAGVRPERLEEARQLAGEAIDITVSPAAATFSHALSAAGPVAGNVVAHVRDGGRIFTTVRIPDGANPGNRVNILTGRHRTDARVLTDVANAAASGDLQIPIARTFPLEQLGAAHAAFVAGVQGKIVLLH